MKIRIYDDSIRLRLDRDEVERIGRLEAVERATRFPSGAVFRYRLTPAATDAVSAVFDDACIEIVLPESLAEHWARTDTEVSISAEQALGQGQLTLLVEKDFECLEPRAGEDQSNRFKNPRAAR